MCWKTIIALLGGVVALCSACGAPPHKVPSPHLPLARYAATATVESGKVTRVSVSCQPGEQVLGGGFSSGGLFEYAAFLEASYPSSPTTWSVMAFGPTFGLEAEVYCLPTTVPLGVQIVQASGTGVVGAACPQGTVLFGGGFQSSQVIGASRPQGNGWMSASTDARVKGYALCAASHALRGRGVSAVFNPHSSLHGYAPGRSGAACPAGQVATGGGLESEDLIVGSDATGPAFADWSVAAGGESDMTIFAVCVVLQE